MDAKFKSTAVRIDLRVALVYALFGGLWILISDRMLADIISDPSRLSTLQTYKGWIFVALSSLLIFFHLKRELTLRRIAEGGLHESEERYRLLFENSIEAILLSVMDGRAYAANPAACRMFGWSEAEFKELSRDDIVDTSDSRLQAALAERDLNGNFHGELIFVRKDGTKFPAEVSSTTFVDKGGNTRTSTVLRDISKRKKAEAALQKSEQDMQALLISLDDVIFQFDEDGTYLNIWASDESLLVRPKAEMLGYQMEDVLGKEIGQAATEQVKQVLTTGRSETKEYALDVLGGRRWFTTRVSPIRNADGSCRTASMLIRDITEKKQAEEALHESQERFRNLFETSPDTIFIVDQETGEIIFANLAASQLYGYSHQEFLHMRIQDISGEPEKTTSAIQAGITHIASRIHRKKDGSLFPVEITGSYFGHYGHQLHTAFIRDITERKRSEEYIRYQASLLDNVSDAIIASNMHSNITSWNPAAESIYGWGTDEAIGKSVNQLLQTEYEGTTQTEVFQQFLKDGLWRGEVTQKRKDGGRIGVFASVSLVRDNLGEPSAMIAINRDITARKQAEEELRILNAELEQRVAKRTQELTQMNAELEHASRAKDEFLANMSHELRTPLNSILGLSETLLEQRRGLLTESQQNSLQIIESSGHHLLGLINDILDLSKIEAGRFDFYPQPISVDDLCRASLPFIKAQAMKKSISVIYTNEASVSRIYADPRRLKQILVNLLTNAVKFSYEHGTVTLQVACDPLQELIRFSVIDNGIGIAPEDLRRLFQPFVQVDSGLNRQYDGTGLGLTLVQKLTDLHGGSVSVESEVGKGSRFTISLACKQNEIAKLEALQSQAQIPTLKTTDVPSETSIQRHVILLAEDSMPNILTIGEYMENHGYEVVVAHDGLEAIAKAEEFKPDLILMDIQMPVMNGLEAIAHLRADPRFASTPIVALTALAMPGDRERCLQVGATEYMSKPVSLKILLKVIEKLTNSHK